MRKTLPCQGQLAPAVVDIFTRFAILGWTTEDASSVERRYGLWVDGEFNALTPGWPTG